MGHHGAKWGHQHPQWHRNWSSNCNACKRQCRLPTSAFTAMITCELRKVIKSRQIKRDWTKDSKLKGVCRGRPHFHSHILRSFVPLTQYWPVYYYSWWQKSVSKIGACSAAAEHSAHSNNATCPAVRLTVLSIPSYACTGVTVAADLDDSADCKALTVTVFLPLKPAVSMGSLWCTAASKSHRQPDLERLVLSGKTGQLSCLVFTFSNKPKYCELQHFHKKPDNLLVEQALLWKKDQAKTVQPASPCFQCNLFQVQKKLPGCCLTDFLTLTLTADKDKDNDIRTSARLRLRLRRTEATCYIPLTTGL